MTKAITSRERVLLALERKYIDRVPIGFEVSEPLVEKLCQYFGVSNYLELFKELDIDAFSIWRNSYISPKYIGPELKKLNGKIACDFWGISFHQEVLPLEFAQDIADLSKYQWPEASWFDYSNIEEDCVKVKESGYVSAIGEGGIGIQFAINMRGYQNALIDPLIDSDFTHAYMARACDFFMEWNEKWITAANGEADMFRAGDEIGANDRTHVAGDQWREFYKPYFKKVFKQAKDNDLKIWFHCCGCMDGHFDDLVDIGVDLLDPIPDYVMGNNHKKLAAEYGDKLCFVGGVDTVNIMQKGSVEDVENEVKRVIDIFYPDCGLIIGTSQQMTEDVPLENAIAFFKTALEYGKC